MPPSPKRDAAQGGASTGAEGQAPLTKDALLSNTSEDPDNTIK
jgi:hypothetical protein